MTQEDLFKVMDALQLSVDDVRQYLKKMCKTTPLKLAFKSRNGKTYCTNHPEERKDSDIFLGIVIETTIFSPAEFDIRSLKKKNGTSFKFHEGFWAEEIYSCDIFDWAMHFGCYPAREEQMELLYKFRFEYLRLFLTVYQCSLCFPKNIERLLHFCSELQYRILFCRNCEHHAR